jgi:hypothetical protein
MDLKIIFHVIAAVIAGAVVIMSTLGPFQNKIVIVCVLVGIGLILEVAVIFVKTNKPPVFNYSIKLIDSDYAPEIEVDGVKWIDGFKRYRFNLSSNEKTSEALNVNIVFMFPTGIASYKLTSHNGCEDVSFPEIPVTVHNIDSDKKMFDTVQFYHNLLKINALKIHPGGSITLNIILTFHGPWDEVNKDVDRYGLFDISYNSLEQNEKSKFRYAILFSDRSKKEMYIDTSKPASSDMEFSSIIMPKEKIWMPFEKGTGLKFSEVPGSMDEGKKDNSN